MGKGSGRRPLKIDKAKFESNWDQIFGRKTDADQKDQEGLQDRPSAGAESDQEGSREAPSSGQG